MGGGGREGGRVTGAFFAIHTSSACSYSAAQLMQQMSRATTKLKDKWLPAAAAAVAAADAADEQHGEGGEEKRGCSTN